MITDWIGFGQVSAERDENLSEYFFENGVLESAIRNRHQFLILGRKGAGKTAVFQHFSDNTRRYIGKNDLSASLSLQNYSWDIHGLLATEGKAFSLAFIQSWKYVIYLTAVKILLEHGIETKRLKGVRRLISRLYTSPTPSLSEIISSKLLQLSCLKLPKGGLDFDGLDFEGVSIEGGEVSFSEIQNSAPLQSSLNSSIERVSDILEETLLDALSDNRRLFVTFDRIDEAWDVASFEASQRMIAGLIGASESITAKFRGSLRPIVFLREDIFETLILNDKNKLRADCGQLLAWSKDTLARMLLVRINYFAKIANKPEFAHIQDLFDRDQMRQSRAPFDYIMLRTMLRPRDFIRMFQLVKENILEKRNNPYEDSMVNEDRLECQSIYNVEPAYSEWLLEEIRDEWRVQYPKVIDLLAALQNNGSTVLSANDLAGRLQKSGVSANVSDINGYLHFLYDNSIIGFRVGNSQQWRFKCFTKSQGFIESENYKVHEGLHRGLNLKETRRTETSSEP